jgi:four helix bundle protein
MNREYQLSDTLTGVVSRGAPAQQYHLMLTQEKSAPRSFQESPAWKASHELTLSVYGVTLEFPRLETFGLTHELRRSAAAVGANIADGLGRHSWSEQRRLAQEANGRLEETKHFLLLATDLGFLKKEDCERLFRLAEKTAALIADMDRQSPQQLFAH